MSAVGDPNEPSWSPIGSGAWGDEFIWFHGHVYDTVSTPDGSAYHTHVWAVEVCGEDVASDADPNSYFAQTLLSLVAFEENNDPWAASVEYSGVCDETFIRNVHINPYLTTPAAPSEVREDFIDLSPEGCP